MSYNDDRGDHDKRKRMSCGLQINCPANIQECLLAASNDGYHFIITQIAHPNYTRFTPNEKPCKIISRTDRILTGNDWNRLIVGKLNSNNNNSIIYATTEYNMNFRNCVTCKCR